MSTQPFEVYLSVSGGKDSAAFSLYLAERGIEHRRVFADTGWEHPDTYAYIRDVLEPTLGPIAWVRSDVELPPDLEAVACELEARLGHYSAMVRWILKKSMFPSRQRRFCTENLKVLPVRDHIAASANASPWMVINAVGIRAGESFARSQLPEWEVSNMDLPCWTWRGIISWSEVDVIAIHKRHGLKPNPLYLKGASRVGCWPCIFARKLELAMVAGLTPGMIDVIESLERFLTARSLERVEKRQKTPIPDGLDDDAREIAEQLRDPSHWRNQRTFFGVGGKGRMWDFYDIRRTVEWAQTDRGGLQLPMFSPLDEAAADGCMRWGLCETGGNK